MIDIKDVITLDDDKEYLVVSKSDYFNSKQYFSLVDINDNSNIKFGYLDNDEFVEINDQDLIKTLLPSFAENTKKELPQEVLDKLNQE